MCKKETVFVPTAEALLSVADQTARAQLAPEYRSTWLLHTIMTWLRAVEHKIDDPHCTVDGCQCDCHFWGRDYEIIVKPKRKTLEVSDD